MIKMIALATDFSARSDRALRRATIIAKRMGASLTLVHVIDDDQPQYLVDAQMHASRAILDESARTVREFDGVDADARLVAGDVYPGILQVAEDVAADLIVLGPHRRQLRNVFIGTTAERTIAHSPRPVLMTAGVPSAPYDRALVALDLDEGSRLAARKISEMEILAQTEVVAMHAYDVPALGMMRRGMHEQSAVDQYLTGEQRQATDDFRTFVSETGLSSARQILAPISGNAARTICECAREEDAALVVVATGQRTGLERLMLGSVAADVLADADRDVLVVPK